MQNGSIFCIRWQGKLRLPSIMRSCSTICSAPNSDLTLAYDATIEGWSRALDLRDRETEGHTERVTDMTLRLARAFGLE